MSNWNSETAIKRQHFTIKTTTHSMFSQNISGPFLIHHVCMLCFKTEPLDDLIKKKANIPVNVLLPRLISHSCPDWIFCLLNYKASLESRMISDSLTLQYL